jgi:aspartyl-tRNA(Asn)/glutamyl-tRNA(Gln) amidotransferase subunit A
MPRSAHDTAPPSSELWRQDAVGLSARIASGAVTPKQLLEMYLARCDRLQPTLNAFSMLDRPGATAAAREATERQKAGRRRGPLDGIPVAIKDNLYVGGLPAEWGSRMLEGSVADRDDICVERLRAAGAVIIGKTTTPEFALSGKTENLATGTTRNPWDPRLTPGGSSGGAVASVASGMVPLAIGTDAGGSTRMPAGYTGLVGLRPSNGRIPRCYGFPPMALDFQAIGPITRTVRDLELLFGMIGGPDSRDPVSLQLAPPRRQSLPRRLGWFTTVGEVTASSDVRASHARVLQLLQGLGYTVEQCAPPFDIAEIRALWDTLTCVGAARAARRIGADWKTLATDQIRGLVARGLAVPAADYVGRSPPDLPLEDLRELGGLRRPGAPREPRARLPGRDRAPLRDRRPACRSRRAGRVLWMGERHGVRRHEHTWPPEPRRAPDRRPAGRTVRRRRRHHRDRPAS